MRPTFNGPQLVTTPWHAANRDVVQHDAFRFIKRARRARMPISQMLATTRAILAGSIPVFGRIGKVGHDGAVQHADRMTAAVIHDRQAADVLTAIGFASGNQRRDDLFGRLQFLGVAEGQHGSLRGLVCAVMEERVVGGVESPADGEASENRA